MGCAAAAYATYVAYTWLSFGHVSAPAPDEQDELLDRFMPAYDIVERHKASLTASASLAFTAACAMDIERSVLVRALFKTREWIMRGDLKDSSEKLGFIPQMRAIGWGVLAEIPGREIVLGAVTQPWAANPIFRPLSPEEFATFQEPGYVKIAWTLRADPLGPSQCVFRTETRAIPTDPAARSKFRVYWSFVSPGVILIRWMTLSSLRAEVERRKHQRAPQFKEETPDPVL